MKILTVGHALMDYFVFGSEEDPAVLGLHLGTFNHLNYQRLHPLIQSVHPGLPTPGGSAANVVRLAAHMGLETTFAGKCGNDALGTQFETEMKQAGVDCRLQKGDGPTGISLTHLCSGRRTVATARAAAGEITPNLVADDLFDGVTHVHLEGYLLYNREVFYSLLRKAKEKGVQTSFDPGTLVLIEDFREEILLLIENFVDFLFLNDQELIALTGQGWEEGLTLVGTRCPCVALKKGDQGSLIYTAGQKYTIPSIGPVVVDPTGAGDGYTAGFLYGLAHTNAPDLWGKAASLVAAEVVREPGTKIDAGRLSTLKKLLADLVD